MANDYSPAWLAHVDQHRAATESTVRALVSAYRDHAEQMHEGDVTCSHAGIISTLLERSGMEIADIAAGAVGMVVRLEATVAELRDEQIR